MNNYLKQIVELSNIDKEIESFTPRLESINAKLKSEEEKSQELQKQIDAIDTSLEEIKNQKKQNNTRIAEFSDKITDCQKKYSTIKTEKEAQALKLEEEIAKESLEAANAEIERLEKVQTAKKTEKEEKKSALQELVEQMKQTKEQTDEQTAQINAQMNKVYEKKQALTLKIDTKVLSFYEKIKNWAKSTAVVPVRKQACYGCFMRIDDTTYNKILKDDEINTCPHCGRIVYKEQN